MHIGYTGYTGYFGYFGYFGYTFSLIPCIMCVKSFTQAYEKKSVKITFPNKYAKQTQRKTKMGGKVWLPPKIFTGNFFI